MTNAPKGLQILFRVVAHQYHNYVEAVLNEQFTDADNIYSGMRLIQAVEKQFKREVTT